MKVDPRDLQRPRAPEDAYAPEGAVSLVVASVSVGLGVVVYTLAPTPIIGLMGLAVGSLAFLVVSVATIKRLLLAVMLLEMALQIDVYIGFNEIEAARATLSGYNVSMTSICLAALYGIWLTESLGGVRSGGWYVLRSSIPAIAYSLVLLGSAVIAINPTLVFYEFAIVGQAVLILIYIAHAIRTRSDLHFVMALVVSGLVIQSSLAVFTYVTGASVNFGVFTSGLAGGRVAGSIGGPNSLGGYLAILLPIALALAIAPVPRWLRRLSTVGFVLGVGVLGLTGSRGAFAGFAVGLALVAAVTYRNRLVSRAVLGRAALIAIVPLGVLMLLMWARLADYNNAAAISRLPLIALATDMIRENLLVGVGANNFALALERYLTIDFNTAWISTVHNRYLLVWAETGIIGLATLLWFLVDTARRGFRLTALPDHAYALVATGVLGGFAAACVHMVVELYHSRPLVHLVWLLAGILIGLSALAYRDAVPRRSKERV